MICRSGAQWSAEQHRFAQGDKDHNRIPKAGTLGWMLWNLYGGYQAQSFIVKLSLHNMSNKDYRTPCSGINQMGRALVEEVNYKLCAKLWKNCP